MIVQFFGMDVANRNLASKAFANESKSFYCTDRELPMASLEAQFARWLRTISGVAHRNGMPDIVLSGYFPSKESRQQFKEGMDISNIITVWIDTIDPTTAPIPQGNGGTTDFVWENPDESEYDIRVKTTEDLASLSTTIKEILG
jgi:hypothetical protein